MSEVGEEKYKDEDWLRDKLVNEGLTQEEVGRKCGVVHSAISYWSRKFDIQTGTTRPDDARYKNEAWLRTKYIDERLNQPEIADLCDVSRKTISYWFDKFDISVRNQCTDKHRSIISDRLSGRTISKEHREKLSRNSNNPSGSDHPHYKPPDERIHTVRGPNWSQQRRKALKRADHSCEHPDCSEDRETLGRNPDVHHIVPFRCFGEEQYQEANDLDNLIVLCRPHHKKLEPSEKLTEDLQDHPKVEV